jgi:hypothetical protein
MEGPRAVILVLVHPHAPFNATRGHNQSIYLLLVLTDVLRYVLRYNLQGDRCVPNTEDLTYTGDDCARDPPGFYLTAVPGEGCVCRPSPSPEWCHRTYLSSNATRYYHLKLCTTSTW